MSDSVAEAHCQNATVTKEMSDSKPDKILQATEELPNKLENFIQNEADHVKNNDDDDDDEKEVKSKKSQKKPSSRINREAEALLKDLGHQDQEDTELDTGRRRTRSSTRGKPATPPPLVKREKRSSRTSSGETSVKGRKSKKNVGVEEAPNGTIYQSISQGEKDHIEQSRVPDTMDVSEDKQDEEEVGFPEIQAPPQETPHEIISQEEEKPDINFESSISKTSTGTNGEAPVHSPKLVEGEQPTTVTEKDSQIA